MSRRASRMRERENPSTLSPRKSTSPDVGSIRRRMQRPVVLLPLPDSPTRPNISPSSIVKLTSSTALTIDGFWKSPCLRDEVLDEMTDLQERAAGSDRSLRVSVKGLSHRARGSAPFRGRRQAGSSCTRARGWRRICRTGPFLDQLALVHDRDAVGHFGDDAEVVRDEQQRQVEARLRARAAGRAPAPGS